MSDYLDGLLTQLRVGRVGIADLVLAILVLMLITAAARAVVFIVMAIAAGISRLDRKTCPACMERVKVGSTKCRFCGTALS